MEDGTPFCPDCGAPQIRIRRYEAAQQGAATPPLPPGTPGEVQPPAFPLRLDARPATGWRAGRRPAIGWGLLATAALFFSMASPPAFFVVAVFGFGFAGGLAVNSFARRSREPLSAGLGARIGAIAGLVGLIAIEVVAVLSGLSAAYLVRGNAEMRASIERQLQAAEPQVRAMMMRLLDRPGELTALLIAVAFFYGLIFVVAAAAGGALRGRRP